ncbi:RIG-I signaling pathway [Mactra antiquata]
MAASPFTCEYIKNNRESFKKEIHRYQDEANLDRELKAFGKKRKVIRTGQFELRCIKCDHFICWSDDVKKIEGAHHVIVDQSLEERVKMSSTGPSKYQNETIQLVGKVICRNCGGNLGTVLIHRKMEFPVPRIENFLIVDTHGRQDTCKQWKGAPFDVQSLSTDDWREILTHFKDKEGIE